MSTTRHLERSVARHRFGGAKGIRAYGFAKKILYVAARKRGATAVQARAASRKALQGPEAPR